MAERPVITEQPAMTVPGFEFATAGRIVFGAGRAAELPGILAGMGTRVFVCTGTSASRYAALLSEVTMPAATFPVAGEPTIDVARAGVAAAREHGADFVAAIGGGSVIDTGKAVAMLLGNGGDPLDYLEVIGSGQKITRPSLPFTAVPTTAGTGAEVTANATLASPADGLKASLRSALMLPRIALVDPRLTLDCPRAVTAASGLDALTQCLEPYVCRQASPLTDGLAREGLRRAAAGLRAAYADGSDLRARTDMSTCSLLGGMALANAKLGAVHGLAGVVGGTASVPHGVACAALLVPVMTANVQALRAGQTAHPALERYAEAARLLTGRPDAAVEDGIEWVRETVGMLAIPGLASFGVRPEEAGEIAEKASRSSSMQGNPVQLSIQELEAILLQAL
jgi:alcohol dehydrogenase class IV